jgi:hypothetical protein
MTLLMIAGTMVVLGVLTATFRRA